MEAEQSVAALFLASIFITHFTSYFRQNKAKVTAKFDRG